VAPPGAVAATPGRDLSAYEMPADFVPASAAGLTDGAPFSAIFLAEISNGQAAIDALGSQLPAVAAWYGKSSAELVKLLQSDRTVHVDRRGRLLHIDDGVAVAQAQPPGEHPAYAGAALPGSFSTTEQALIQRIWLRVAEDYAAFDVDITTEAPKTTAGKTGVTIMVTSRVIGSGGYAYLNAFSALKLAPAPAFCFQNKLANAEKPIAECLSHEVGHTLGLGHQGTNSAAHYGGQGSGETAWAPIMGVSYYKSLSHGAKGEFNGATNQDDVYAVMARQGLSPRADDHGNKADKATRVAGTVSKGWLASAVNGVIESPTDVDTFSFTAGAGKLSLGVTSSVWSGNVDLALALCDAVGKLTVRAAPLAGNDNLVLGIELQDGAGKVVASGHAATRPRRPVPRARSTCRRRALSTCGPAAAPRARSTARTGRSGNTAIRQYGIAAVQVAAVVQ
jgi:hypothetical protein